MQLNHTIVWCRDKETSAAFLTDVRGLPPPRPFGPMLVLALAPEATLVVPLSPTCGGATHDGPCARS